MNFFVLKLGFKEIKALLSLGASIAAQHHQIL